MPATAWDLFCSAWFSVISHWPMTNSSFSHRSCSLSGWQCLVVLLCSARFIGSVRPSQGSAFLWLAISPALRCRGPNNALLLSLDETWAVLNVIPLFDISANLKRPVQAWHGFLV